MTRTALNLGALQTSVAQQWGRDMETQVSATHAAAAARQEELEGVISALNQQLDLLSHQPQVSLYSHFNGPALFGGGMQWMQNSGFAGRSMRIVAQSPLWLSENEVLQD